MSTAVAPALALSTSTTTPPAFRALAPSSSAAHAGGEPSSKRARSNESPEFAGERQNPNSKGSPTLSRLGAPPPIKVKREPGSPALPSSRPRPQRLDLSNSLAASRGPQTARGPLTSRESAGLAIQDVGFACLSPGFQTNDPGMREQLQRSLDVRDQQRQIIEARQKGGKPGSSHDSEASGGPRTQDNTLFGIPTDARGPPTSRRKGPPAGLSIHAPSAAHFANDRVIQSAPLHQTFTGLRPGEFPHSRHVQHGPSGLSQTSHIHHVPATQTNNRLPPIADVFAQDRLEAARGHSNSSPRGSHNPLPAPSPGFPPSHMQQTGASAPPAPHHSGGNNSRPREFRSSEEAIQGMSGGREDMLPKVVHYGGVQPPTPPSPMPHNGSTTSHPHHYSHQQSHKSHYPGQHPPPPHPSADRHHTAHAHGAAESPHHLSGGRPDMVGRTSSMNGRRRGRDEYERDQGSSPPLAPPPPPGTSGSSTSSYYGQHHGPAGGSGYHAGAASGHDASEYRRPATLAVRGDDRDRGHASEEDWRSGMSAADKREEFMRLMERAWDLFHS